MPDVVRHLTFALSAHLRRLHQDGRAVPREVEELTIYLIRSVSFRQEPPLAARGPSHGHDAHMSGRLLVTKGEAAERLGVSVRTVERLVATGRLPQVHIERSARFRVRDLEAYVDGLTGSASGDVVTDGRFPREA